MRSALLFNTLVALKSINRTVVIEGPPGGGKTTIVHEVGAEIDLPVIECHLPTMAVEDFGIPYFGDQSVAEFNYKLPHWYPYKGKPGTERGGILLIDDRNQGGADLQKVLANLCQARTLHGVPLADNWMVVSTGNRQADRAGSNRVLSHLRNRETVLEYETNLDDWTSWAIAHGVKDVVVSFIRFRPGLLHDFDPQRDQNATPRSWVEGVSDIIGVVPPEAEHAAFKGAVGDGPAAEFVGFLRIHRKLPDPDQVILHPKSSPVPTDPATLYALSGAIATRATKENFENVVEYCERMPPEFAVLTVSYAARRDVSLADTKAFTRWTTKYQDVMF